MEPMFQSRVSCNSSGHIRIKDTQLFAAPGPGQWAVRVGLYRQEASLWAQQPEQTIVPLKVQVGAKQIQGSLCSEIVRTKAAKT